VRHRSRPVARLIPLILALPLLVGAGEGEPGGQIGGQISADVVGLRSDKGEVVACLTARADTFPECQRDPLARAVRVPAGQTVRIAFGAVPAGRYAIALFHDENGNGKLDKALMMPREGYGFSRDAAVMMGPPRFANAVFVVDAQGHHETIRMRYIF
jgi:uncharacterized protein (DUF2141 family)